MIILGILAAIVIPQFTEASNDARESALASDLQMLRSQIELYKVQHAERLPSQDALRALDTANFVNRLTQKTDLEGTLDAAGAFGPYMQKFPSNPFVPEPNNIAVTFGVLAASPGLGDTGWYYNTDNGQIWPNDAEGHEGM